MKRLLQLALTALITLAANAQAGVITDTYWGGNDHGYGDIIGTAMYDVSSAKVTVVGNMLNIRINTNFAGNAGADAWAATKGIGYGDVFLAAAWNPAGIDAHHLSDSAATGTKWTYALNLDNRWANGGNFTLYELNGATNASNILNSQSFMRCAIGSQCYYRDGQATATKTTSGTVRNTGLTGKWTVDNNAGLNFSIDITGTSLLGYGDMALHWGETCQNDVIEGSTHVPEPASLALVALGLLGLGLRRRKS